MRHLNRLPESAQGRPRALALFVADYAGTGCPYQTKAAAAELVNTSGLSEEDVAPVLAVIEARHEDRLELRLLEGLRRRNLVSLPTLQRLGTLYAGEGWLAESRSTLDQAPVGEPKPVAPSLSWRTSPTGRRTIPERSATWRARDLDSQNDRIHFLFGMMCVQDNLDEEAYQSLKKSVLLEPDDPYYDHALGAVILNRESARYAVPYFSK